MSAETSVSTSQSVSRGILVMLRLYTGIAFFLMGWGKITEGFDITQSLNFFMQRSHEFYKPFLESFVLTNPDLFNILIPYGELLAGIGLIIGLFTPLAAVGVMLMTLNFMLLKGAWFWQASSNDAAFFFIALALLLGAAGRMMGVDQMLAQKSPKGWLW